jgi:holliday junction DNA helicase RuvB
MAEKKNSFLESSFTKEDICYEAPLRPQALADFYGQEEIKERLEVLIEAAKLRKEPLGHCLFSGPPGLGKTTLANIVAKAMGSSIVVTSGPILERPSDLAGILTNLQQGDILFIDEIHRMQRSVEEYLYPSMEDFVLDIMIDQGACARSVQVKLNRFTLIGATTRSGLISAPMRSRFSLSLRLDYYDPSVLINIIKRSSKILNTTIDEEGIMEIANRSRGTPRIANNLLRWVRDFAQVRSKNLVSKEIARKALEMLAIDEKGLDEMDKKILNVIMNHYDGGPVGINTLSMAVGEEGDTIEEVHEPFLILLGFIKRTPRGRMATERAYEHFGIKIKSL